MEVTQIVLRSRSDATAVLEKMNAIKNSYGFVSIGDLKDLVGLPPTYNDSLWGWKTLYGTEVRAVREGFVLDLPEPVQERKGTLMKKAFRDRLVENADSAVKALHTLLTTEGGIVDVSQVDGKIVESAQTLMVRLDDYAEQLRAREVN